MPQFKINMARHPSEIRRRILGLAHKTARNLADHKRRFRFNSGDRTRMIPALRGRSKGEEAMTETEASGALHDDRRTSQANSVTSGGLPPNQEVTSTVPRLWGLQCLVAAIKKSERRNPPQREI